MAAIAGSLYLISTALFCAVCLTIGWRLVGLSRRTGGRPELLLGVGLGLTGGVGYGGLIALALLREALGGATGPLFTWGTALCKAAHDVGVLSTLGFTVTVFRPATAWARGLAVALGAVLWLGYAGYLLEGGFAHGLPVGFWYWLEFSVIGSYPAWGAAEAFRYHAVMRRRQTMGLAEPLVVNRFLLWGVGSCFALAAIWTITIPALTGAQAEEALAGSEVYMLVTALFGMGSIGAYWLTFFPPRWYRARLGAAA